MMRIIFFVCAFAAAIALGAETNLTLTVDGVTYNGVRFGRATPTSVTIFHSTGVATVPLAKLPPEFQKQFGYDPQQAAAWQAAQQQAAAETADAQRKAAAAVEWSLTVERVLPDGIIARGHKSSADVNQITICLVDDPHVGELAEGNKFTTRAYKAGVIAIEGRTLEKWAYYEPTPHLTTQPPAAPPPASSAGAMSLDELHRTGAFGFPQKEAWVLCNHPALRVSVWNNDQYLFAQAVLWTDGDASTIKYKNGWEEGDSSDLWLDLNDDGKMTAKVDREYRLNQRPSLPGLYYQIPMGGGSTSGLKNDSQGWGAIRYLEVAPGKLFLHGAEPLFDGRQISYQETGKRVRVDTYLIPLAELSKKVGDKIRICYWGRSPKPSFTICSMGEEYVDLRHPNDNFCILPLTTEYRLIQGYGIDATQVPDGRLDSRSIP
jgi:hypothetical protein